MSEMRKKPVDRGTLQDRVIKELGYGMGVTTEHDIAFMAMWVSRRLSDGHISSTICNMVDEPLTDELRAKIAEVIRRLADTVEAELGK